MSASPTRSTGAERRRTRCATAPITSGSRDPIRSTGASSLAWSRGVPAASISIGRRPAPAGRPNLPQIRLEPILKARAEALAPGRPFNTEAVDIEQDADGVTATVRDKTSGVETVVRARYVLACDGGRTVGRRLGIEMQGARDVMRIVSVYMSADLSRWVRDPDVLIRWLWIPHRGTFCTLVPMGPDHWGPDSEEWVFHLNYLNDDTRAIDDAQVVADMKEALGLPDLDAEVHVVSRWALEGILADRFQVGRVFLVGDAAHRHPPTGGLGLNSAVHDAHNLCWKVAAVLHGHAGEALLTTYEAERRPVDARNVERSMENGMNHAAVGEAMGFVREAAADTNLAGLRSGARRYAGRRRASPESARGGRDAIDGVPRAPRRVRADLRVHGDRRRRHARADASGRRSPLRPRHPARCPASACRGRRPGRRSTSADGSRAAGAVPADRRRGRPALVRGREGSRGHRGIPDSRRPYRCTRRRVSRSPVRLASASRHRSAGRRARATGSLCGWRSLDASATPEATLGAVLAKMLCRTHA